MPSLIWEMEGCSAPFSAMSSQAIAERGSALILSGETGTLYEGLILDQGSDDYLQAEELARALAGRGVDLVVLDSGFSAGFEFLYEIGKTLEEPPLMLLSSGPFPREGRNYGRLFSSYPAQETFRPQDFSVHIQDEFTRAHGSDPRSRQLIADPAGAQSFMGHFNALLAAVHSEIDTDLKRKGLRSELMFASPSYYETPGNLHIALGAILESFQQELGDDLDPALMQNSRNSLAELYPARGRSAGTPGELSLFFVPLLSNGSPNPNYPPAYERRAGKAGLCERFGLVPKRDTGKGVLLHRLWLESLP